MLNKSCISFKYIIYIYNIYFTQFYFGLSDHFYFIFNIFDAKLFLSSTAYHLLYNDRKCLQDIVSFYVEDFELGKTVLHSYQTSRESKTILTTTLSCQESIFSHCLLSLWTWIRWPELSASSPAEASGIWHTRGREAYSSETEPPAVLQADPHWHQAMSQFFWFQEDQSPVAYSP